MCKIFDCWGLFSRSADNQMEVFLLEDSVQVEEGGTRSDLSCFKDSLRAEIQQLMTDFPGDPVKEFDGVDYQIRVCINNEELTLVLNCREHEYKGVTTTGNWHNALDDLFQNKGNSLSLAEDASLIVCPY